MFSNETGTVLSNSSTVRWNKLLSHRLIVVTSNRRYQLRWETIKT